MYNIFLFWICWINKMSLFGKIVELFNLFDKVPIKSSPRYDYEVNLDK